LNQLNISWMYTVLYPALPPIYLAGYPAVQSSIRADTGYQKRLDYLAGYPVHGKSLNVKKTS
jgi:hypothetical protein